ncbi:MAG: hypothetical protein U5L04_01430 [Trueperaceae bacterium]|nr:hypothetical protein [Trueperaceae bacterium]
MSTASSADNRSPDNETADSSPPHNLSEAEGRASTEDTGTVDAEVVDPETADTESVDPEAVDTRADDTEAVDTRVDDTEAAPLSPSSTPSDVSNDAKAHNQQDDEQSDKQDDKQDNGRSDEEPFHLLIASVMLHALAATVFTFFVAGIVVLLT